MSFLIHHRQCLRPSVLPGLQALQLKTDMENRQYRRFPHYTRQGYRTARLPPALRERLTRTWTQKRHQAQREDYDTRYITGSHSKDSDKPAAHMLSIHEHDPELMRDIEAFIKEELVKWTGMHNLRHTATYGIREYSDGAVLHTHVDQYTTHILSAIWLAGHAQAVEPGGAAPAHGAAGADPLHARGRRDSVRIVQPGARPTHAARGRVLRQPLRALRSRRLGPDPAAPAAGSMMFH